MTNLNVSGSAEKFSRPISSCGVGSVHDNTDDSGPNSRIHGESHSVNQSGDPSGSHSGPKLRPEEAIAIRWTPEPLELEGGLGAMNRSMIDSDLAIVMYDSMTSSPGQIRRNPIYKTENADLLALHKTEVRSSARKK
jgi:hypothetical protein